MAKGKKNVNSDDGVTKAKPRVKGHHAELLASGAMHTAFSRPKGKPYSWEEWVTKDMKPRVLKVFDDGTVDAYEKVASYGDPRAAAESQR